MPVEGACDIMEGLQFFKYVYHVWYGILRVFFLLFVLVLAKYEAINAIAISHGAKPHFRLQLQIINGLQKILRANEGRMISAV
jgi:hypothetical protein